MSVRNLSQAGNPAMESHWSDGKSQATSWPGDWLSDMDSNHDKGLQRALCYHYTIGQARRENICHSLPRNGKFPPNGLWLSSGHSLRLI
jgi:hypothetical protein